MDYQINGLRECPDCKGLGSQTIAINPDTVTECWEFLYKHAGKPLIRQRRCVWCKGTGKRE